MKHLIYIVLSLVGLFTVAACSEDVIENESPHITGKSEIVVTLTSGHVETKAHLYSQENWHHVEKVYAILYYCGPTTVTQADPQKTTVITSQILKKDGQVWNPSLAMGETGDEIQAFKESFSLTLPKENIALVPGKYMVLCVGLDDQSGETYGLDFDEAKKLPVFAQPGATLAQATAILQGAIPTDPASPYQKDQAATDPAKKEDRDLITYGHPEMAHAELFAGWQLFDFMPDDMNVVEVELRRRVAGVLCYLSDIPYKLNIESHPYRVTEVRLTLSGKQNTQIPLRRDVTTDGKPSATDFGSEAKASEVVCQFDLRPFGSNQNQTLYQIPTAHLQGREQLENTILMGAYLLPFRPETPDQSTLSVELWGYPFEDHLEGDYDPNETLTLVKRFPALHEMQVEKDYSLHPNVIYHIGQKLDNGSTEGDYPESLAGTKVTVKEEDWTKVDVEVEFPSVPIKPVMRMVCAAGEYKVQPKADIQDDPFYIFDCMGMDSNYLIVNPSILHEEWRLKVVSLDQKEDHMIYLQSADDKTKLVDSYDGKGTDTIRFVITDYVDLEGPDIRNVMLRLVSRKGDQELPNESSLTVSQYNAIIVEVKDEDGKLIGSRGFSHYDYKAQRNLSTGAVRIPGEKIQWGYFSSVTGAIYDRSLSDGKQNWESARSDVAADKGFNGSAMQKCAADGCEVTKEGELQKDPGTWYLPAYYELESFMKQSSENVESDWYWSSTTYILLANRAYAFRKGGECDYWNRKREYYVRQACHVN